jgi:hypothetical protein
MDGDTGSRRTVTYVPKRDRWVTLLLWGTALLLAWAAFWGATEPMAVEAKIGITALYGAVILMCLAPLYTLSYVLSDQTLRVGCGPVGMTLALQDIEAVTTGMKTGLTLGWSMALKGLVIERRGKRWKVFISPLNQGDFLRDLAERCPHLTLRDAGLSR